MNKEHNVLKEVRDHRNNLASTLKDYPGIWEHFEDFYPDDAHFIYELLQNAEDENATLVSFSLENDLFIFEHNGEPFSEEDVWGITDIGRGAKREDEEKIGRFGVGFKSVFAFTSSPCIYSPTYSFKLEERVLPVELPRDDSIGGNTRFVFQLGSEDKTPEEAYEDIYKWLSELSELTLLFLSHLEEIQWRDLRFQRIRHSKYHYEVRKTQKNKIVNSQHFLRYSELVSGLNSQYTSVAFPLSLSEEIKQFDPQISLSDQFKITAADTGTVFVSFPAIKETSGLNFHLHAPFITGRSRESVKTNHKDNGPLFEQLSRLVSDSLFHIKDSSLLTAEFLAVLPNKNDRLKEPYAKILEDILDTMNEQPLTPTYNKGYAPAKTLVQSKASLKRLLTKTDIKFLSEFSELDNERREWAIGISQRNSRLDHFLTSLDMADWDVDDFIRLLKNYASEPEGWMRPSEELLCWLKSKSDKWMQSLYAFFYSELEDTYLFHHLDRLLIVRMNDDSLGTGLRSYFPDDKKQGDTIFPRIKESVYCSGKNKKEQKKAKEFLVEIGVTEVGESDLIKLILDERYADENTPDEIDFKTYVSHLERFIRLVEESPRWSRIFSEYYIFNCNDNWVQPSDVYIDSPFKATGLSSYYDALEKTRIRLSPRHYPLSNKYENLEISVGRIATFAIAAGAKTKIYPHKKTCFLNPRWNWLESVQGERYTSSGYNVDYDIRGLKIILKKPTLELSHLIWRTMCSLPEYDNYLKACYQKNATNGARRADSQLVHTLKDACWVPQTNDTFVKPSDAAIELLPDGFPYDSGQEWLEAIDFGVNGRIRLAKKQREQDFAKRLGVSLEDIQFIKNNPERFQQLKEETKREAANKNTISNSKSRNPERRKQRKIERLKVAPSKETVERVRSVRVYSRSEYDHHALLAYYFDEEVDQPFCQICCHDFPFVNQRGEIYVEYVDVLGKRWADSVGVIIPVDTDLKTVLCPVCSEIYKQYIHKDLEAQKQLYNYLLEDHEDNFIICDRDKRRDGKDNRIRFHNTHLDGIRVCLESLPNLTDSSNT